jgi:hypothetical protein
VRASSTQLCSASSPEYEDFRQRMSGHLQTLSVKKGDPVGKHGGKPDPAESDGRPDQPIPPPDPKRPESPKR